jgi:glyoxylase-like metal-dependent hydrolase (beta-lactamase superfamily II)
MQLIQIKNNTYYFDNPSIIGLYRLNEKEVVLIDTGLNDDVAKKVLKIIKENNWEVKAVVNTHSHADHCGGNSLIQKRTEADFYSSRIEKSYIETTSTEPHYLFGSYPPKVLRAKFLQAKPSNIDIVIDEDELNIEGNKFQIIDLKGHSPEQIGLITPDDVFFVADSVIESKIIEKYKFLYNYSLKELFNSLDKIKEIKAEYYVLSHGGVKKSIEQDIDNNLKALESLNEFILDYLEKPDNKNNIHKAMTKEYGLIENIPNYYLNDSLLSSHLGYLIEEGKIAFEVIDGEVKYNK